MNSHNSSATPINYHSLGLPTSISPSSAISHPIALTFAKREKELDLYGDAIKINITHQQWEEIDPEQMWYWAPNWQAQEHEAEQDAQIGNYDDFLTMDNFIESLNTLIRKK